MKCWKDYVIDAHEHRISKKVLIEISKTMRNTIKVFDENLIAGGTFGAMADDVSEKLFVVERTILHYNDKFIHNGVEYDYSKESVL